MNKALFSGAVLCGGRSSRMGTDKAGLIINGKSFLQHQLDTLRSCGIKDLMISASPDSPERRCPGARTVEDLYTDCGPLAGIFSVLKACGTPYCVILSVDSVLVSSKTLTALMQLAEEQQSDITIVRSPSGMQPLTGIYKTSAAEEAERLLLSGKRAVRALFDRFEPLFLELEDSSPELFNCNTAEDLGQLLQHYADIAGSAAK